ncbi:class I SAM-dependent methyltransferase [Zavarzinella formosa]|uniref:class I SAM-dependent methyltransferase n=1 Tax=Zavarzinella formosa TaxID=360055 RepID=UPI0002FC8B99|nr:methyltransferase [Zavarzinella formosa]
MNAVQSPILETTVGDVKLGECRLEVAGRELAVQYAAAFVTAADEVQFLANGAGGLPYGLTLWPASIALAHEIGTRKSGFAGRSVLEIGAGTGLPGIVAAAAGATVLQTDRHELALHLCRLNGERNGIPGLERRLADWTAWDDTRRYDWIIGSDILYAAELHPHLRRIFEGNLAAGGRVLLSDPFRSTGLPLLEAMEKDGWRVTHNRWSLGDGKDSRPVAVYELTRPAKHR